MIVILFSLEDLFLLIISLLRKQIFIQELYKCTIFLEKVANFLLCSLYIYVLFCCISRSSSGLFLPLLQIYAMEQVSQRWWKMILLCSDARFSHIEYERYIFCRNYSSYHLPSNSSSWFGYHFKVYSYKFKKNLYEIGLQLQNSMLCRYNAITNIFCGFWYTAITG